MRLLTFTLAVTAAAAAVQLTAVPGAVAAVADPAATRSSR